MRKRPYRIGHAGAEDRRLKRMLGMAKEVLLRTAEQEDGIQKLWWGVLCQALSDLTGVGGEVLREDAEEWLSGTGMDSVDMVCDACRIERAYLDSVLRTAVTEAGRTNGRA